MIYVQLISSFSNYVYDGKSEVQPGKSPVCDLSPNKSCSLIIWKLGKNSIRTMSKTRITHISLYHNKNRGIDMNSWSMGCYLVCYLVYELTCVGPRSLLQRKVQSALLYSRWVQSHPSDTVRSLDSTSSPPLSLRSIWLVQLSWMYVRFCEWGSGSLPVPSMRMQMNVWMERRLTDGPLGSPPPLLRDNIQS